MYGYNNARNCFSRKESDDVASKTDLVKRRKKTIKVHKLRVSAVPAIRHVSGSVEWVKICFRGKIFRYNTIACLKYIKYHLVMTVILRTWEV